MKPTLRRLLEGADAGHYTLPDWMNARRQQDATVVRLLQETPGRFDLDRAERELYYDVIEAASEGSELPDIGHRLLELRHQHEANEYRRTFLQQAREHASFDGVDQSNGRDIIVNHLRQALTDTIDAARKCASAIKGYQLELMDVNLREHALASAPKTVGAAWVNLAELTDRYAAIRSARDALWIMGIRAVKDDGNYFGELENLDRLWPAFRPNAMNANPTPPWPLEARARLLWLVTSTANIWIPTPEEQDRKYEQWLPDERQRIGREMAGAAVRSR